MGWSGLLFVLILATTSKVGREALEAKDKR